MVLSVRSFLVKNCSLNGGEKLERSPGKQVTNDDEKKTLSNGKASMNGNGNHKVKNYWEWHWI